jgi:hypothetical protein
MSTFVASDPESDPIPNIRILQKRSGSATLLLNSAADPKPERHKFS